MPVKKLCVTCKKWFYNKTTLNRHVKNIHGGQRNVRRFKRQQDNDELRNLLVKSRNFLKNLCDTVEKTNELVQRLETNIEDDISPVRPQNVYQNKTPSSGDRVLHDTTQSFFSPSTLHSNPAKQNGVITGVVRLILPSNSFARKNGATGTVQSFIVVDTLAKRLKSDVWRYKFVVWDEQSKNLPVEKGRTYRFEHFKMQPRNGSFSYPGQDDYEVHLTLNSTIVDVSV
jgi:hypothetical protein